MGGLCGSGVPPIEEPPAATAGGTKGQAAIVPEVRGTPPPVSSGPSRKEEPDDEPTGEASGYIANGAAAGGKTFISTAELGPAASLMDPTQPDWRFELERGKWKSYTLEDSLDLDRYWQAFCKKQKEGTPQVCLAQVNLMKKLGLVDFEAMTCQVGSGRPRKLDRQLKEVGWLSNTYFWEAFKAALAAGGQEVNQRAEDVFDFRWNQDFRGMKDDGRPLFRGGQRYELPMGWKRFAVHVRGLYDGGDNSWLGEDDSGWAVAYHGTSGAGLAGILSSGFNVGGRQKFEKDTGAGVYCTPFLNIAQHYSKPQMQDGKSVQIVLQLRVRPSAIKHITDPKATEFEKKYWVMNNPEDIRAYGVLIRELSIMDYICPEEMVFGRHHPSVKQIYKELCGQ
mmetsp:Transcript_43688/g.112849  ORF Transcript_43688/g.112849 Transcript_43688/m.112849 type:complete len:394 (-) Transcript_43688:57-1238(-)